MSSSVVRAAFTLCVVAAALPAEGSFLSLLTGSKQLKSRPSLGSQRGINHDSTIFTSLRQVAGKGGFPRPKKLRRIAQRSDLQRLLSQALTVNSSEADRQQHAKKPATKVVQKSVILEQSVRAGWGDRVKEALKSWPGLGSKGKAKMYKVRASKWSTGRQLETTST